MLTEKSLEIQFPDENKPSPHIDRFAIDELFRRSMDYKNSEQFNKFFDFIAKFKHYSRYNTMLVYAQNQEVTFFGGITFWKKHNRNIHEDARPYVILAPNGPVMFVYDIFETKGKISPEEFLERGLGNNPLKVDGKISDKIYSDAIEKAKNFGIKIIYKPLSYFKGGHITNACSGRLEICLKKGASNEDNFSVLMHELAHLFLGHTGHKQINYKHSKKPTKLLDRRLTITARELEAETVSYLICQKLGLIKKSSEYIAGYITCEDDIQNFSFELVIKTADKIENLFVDF